MQDCPLQHLRQQHVLACSSILQYKLEKVQREGPSCNAISATTATGIFLTQLKISATGATLSTILRIFVKETSKAKGKHTCGRWMSV